MTIGKIIDLGVGFRGFEVPLSSHSLSQKNIYQAPTVCQALCQDEDTMNFTGVLLPACWLADEGSRNRRVNHPMTMDYNVD